MQPNRKLEKVNAEKEKALRFSQEHDNRTPHVDGEEPLARPHTSRSRDVAGNKVLDGLDKVVEGNQSAVNILKEREKGTAPLTHRDRDDFYYNRKMCYASKEREGHIHVRDKDCESGRYKEMGKERKTYGDRNEENKERDRDQYGQRSSDRDKASKGLGKDFANSYSKDGQFRDASMHGRSSDKDEVKTSWKDERIMRMQPNRKLEKVNAEKEKALRFSQEHDNRTPHVDGEEPLARPHTSRSRDVAGNKVLDGLDKVVEGGDGATNQSAVNILADGDIEQDVLENVEIEQKQRKEAYKPLVLDNVKDQELEKLIVVQNIRKLLLPHQVKGVEWLWGLHCKGEGGILADDMGVGKTLQVCVFIVSLLKSGLTERVLLLAPSILLQQWWSEFLELGFEAHIYHGVSKDKELASVFKGGILLTTYDTLVQNVDPLSKLFWNYMVLDEGHVIKNLKTKRNQSLRSIPSNHRIVLTGTPIQNDINELWSLLNFCMPNKFNDIKNYKETYRNPIVSGKYTGASTSQRQEYKFASLALKKAVGPYVLRRSKEEVLTLSEKHEITVWLKLTTSQRHFYETFVKDGISRIRLAPLPAIEILKKLCDHPALVEMEDENKLKACKDKGASEHLSKRMRSIMREYEDGIESSKILFLEFLLEKLCRESHTILIFTQRAEMLNLIESLIQQKLNGQYRRIDGKTSYEERNKIIKEFQAGSVPILLTTTKVGGVGLTLTRANRVIVVNPDWNPSTDNQAICRAYRFGQTRDVLVYRLVTCGTIEEQTYKRQINKVMLSKVVTEDEDPYSYFTQEELKGVFNKQNFDVSSTKLQLDKIHDSSEICPKIQADMESLKQLPVIAGITYHSCLFTKAAPLVKEECLNASTPKDIKKHQGKGITRLSTSRGLDYHYGSSSSHSPKHTSHLSRGSYEGYSPGQGQHGRTKPLGCNGRPLLSHQPRADYHYGSSSSHSPRHTSRLSRGSYEGYSPGQGQHGPNLGCNGRPRLSHQPPFSSTQHTGHHTVEPILDK